jgi:hypothetical protein
VYELSDVDKHYYESRRCENRTVSMVVPRDASVNCIFSRNRFNNAT